MISKAQNFLKVVGSIFDSLRFRDWVYVFALFFMLLLVSYFAEDNGRDAANVQDFRVRHETFVEGLSKEESWLPVARSELVIERRERWVSARFDLQQGQTSSGEVWLRVSGPFEAEIFFDGVLVGRKQGEGTRAAPIDARFLLPVRKFGPQEIQMKVSSMHAWGSEQLLLQDFRIETGQSQSKRSLRYYGFALAQVGLLVSLLAFFIFSDHSKKAGWGSYAIATVIFALVALFAELIRALYNYPYSWHDLRMAVLSLSLILMGISWTSMVGALFGIERVRVNPYLAALIYWGLAMALSIGGDKISILGLGLCALYAVYLLVGVAGPERRDASRHIVALGAIVAAASLYPWLFLDNGIFVAISILLAPLALRALVDVKMSGEGRITLSVSGSIFSCDPSDLVQLKSASNYVEFHLLNGKTKTIRATLSELSDRLPGQFLRVHRSHIVNLDKILSMSSKPGSRYTVHMDDGSETPVSRQMVKELKDRLAMRDRGVGASSRT